MKYTEMNDNELGIEIIRVRNLVLRPNKPHTYHQNRKYLDKLESEWNKRNAR